MTDIVIASAARTPVGFFNGALANTPADELGAVAIKSALQSAKLDPHEVDEVILGQVLTAAQGQNPARQAAMKAGIPQEKTAWGLNQVCGSGLRAVALGMLHVASEDASIIVAGGQVDVTCTSCCPHACGRQDGRCEARRHRDQGWVVGCIHGYHMGTTAENVAQKWQIRESRTGLRCLPEQGGSSSEGRPFQDEIAPVTCPRARVTLWSLKTNISRRDHA
jgi:acetyl-CoA C-acetyltransferase